MPNTFKDFSIFNNCLGCPNKILYIGSKVIRQYIVKFRRSTEYSLLLLKKLLGKIGKFRLIVYTFRSNHAQNITK